ncbi:FAD-binding protein [Acidiferrimicrobium sp. IK]|uniref:L-aspartate oxidase n=1 Tax=Acidiferrimicrobium sp. IK TaxID=2871700 RepID=UPI0021CB36D5|nr:FAD-binding protein [Acidiferrimicrobium sp. IK]MCU4186978.1 FAD-binding protein [Acidiferrimicrobium sp. IK]
MTGSRPGGPDMDLLIVGSGVAGLSAAVRAMTLEPGIRVGVVSKAELSVSATQWAQGGVAAVLAGAARPEDSIDLHIADTLAAGAGLCDVAATRLLVTDGPDAVRDLVRQGATFDRDPDGALALAREGGHSAARVVHAGGAATGAEIERTLVAATRALASELHEGWYALDLLVERGACRGVVALDPAGRPVALRAANTLLATGGAGQMFSVTTNPPQSTGDGPAMARRAGVTVADVEFMQFHPTALHDSSVPRALLSEALRGEGALLRDASGHRFVDELAPRDVVSRAITRRMLEEGGEHAWLDATGIDDFARHFPTLMPPLRRLGIDPAKDWLPVAPAAHYLSGGIVTDLDGASTLPGLWAAGEAACTGVHGANRLASNSLLEGMVFAARVVDALRAGKMGPSPTGVMASILEPGAHPDHLPAVPLVNTATPGALRPLGGPDPAKAREHLQRSMTVGAGVVRSEASLSEVASELSSLSGPGAPVPPDPAVPTAAQAELGNLVTVAACLVDAALARRESRGAHSRSDFPEPLDAQRVRYTH